MWYWVHARGGRWDAGAVHAWRAVARVLEVCMIGKSADNCGDDAGNDYNCDCGYEGDRDADDDE